MRRGALARAQAAKLYKQGEPREALKQFNGTFPQQMVAATDPNYEKKLLNKIRD